MADPSHPIPSEATSVSFSFLSSQDVRRISVKQVSDPQLFDGLNNPTLGGLYDPAFGPLQRYDVCHTCRLKGVDCPGHFGHIDLPTPVYHPLFMTQTFNLLRGSCQHCHRFLMPPALVAQYTGRLILLERGLVTESDELANVTIQAATPLPKNKSDKLEEQGEDTAENVEEYTKRLWKIMGAMVKKARSEGNKSNRDSYKDAICFDKRKALIAEFLKTAMRKKCSNCGANHHRMRKEGHTKIIQYSLTPKQQTQDEFRGIHRTNVLLERPIVASTSKKTRKSAATDTANAKQLRHDSDEESAQGYNQDEYDSDAESVEPEGPNGRAASPASSSDEESDDPNEAKEDNAMDLDESEQEELEEDMAGVEVSTVEQRQATLGQPRASLKGKQTERIMTSSECRAHLRRLFGNEKEICSLIYCSHGPLATEQAIEVEAKGEVTNASADMFFIDVVCVPPSRFRPAAKLGDMMFESPQNELLSAVLKAVILIRDRKAALHEARIKKLPPPNGSDAPAVQAVPVQDPVRLYGLLIEAMLTLQIAVNSFMDSTKNPMVVRQGKEPPQGIKQVLEKKEGLFRMNMMGKRVNYAARSVISPDVNIETNEIGVPPVFAIKLTFPEPVTPHNVKRMMQLVINGPKVHPGASYIQMEDGHMISLEKMDDEKRHALAQQLLTPSTQVNHRISRPDVGLPQTKTQQINRKVYRHLDDGDILILNRQPTLHKPSMMCHRAKILRGEKTIRMHYANCNSYNADFDGDEMNMHFPQSYIAQAEARMLANTDSQYLVPTSGNPLRGLIQDHVVAGTWMTNKDTFFTRQEYYQLIYGALRPENNYSGGGRVLTMPPAVWKPRPMWTGKQIISTILLNITPPGANGLHMKSKAKVPGDTWGPQNTEEGMVQFYAGDMITGCLDKSQFGATSYGLVHSCYELYGADTAGKLLGVLSRLFTKYLQHRAFSCRMDDLILTKEGNEQRAALIKEADMRGLQAAESVVGLDKEKDLKGADKEHNLRMRLETCLRDDNKLAGLDAIVSSRMGELTSAIIKKTLPSGLVKPFPHNNMQTMTISGAKGSNVNASQISCLLGQQSLEGRRVPTMVSGKTLPSFRAFETAPRAGGYVAQRFLTGIRPQEYYFHCMAGREGLIDTAVKTSRSGYLQRCLIKHLEGIRVNYDNTARNADSSIIQFNYGEDSLDVTKQKSLMQFEFATRNYQSLISRYNPTEAAGKVIEDVASDHMKKTSKAVARAPIGPRGFPVLSGLPDPTLSVFSPSTHIGSTSEAYAFKVNEYTSTNPQRLLKSKKKDRETWHEWERKNKNALIEMEDFKVLMAMRYMRSLADPGEAVGLLASQGVGEPSTQMTLNTFHFAGHGAANVTLGIPRLREIVMTASANIKTPTMKLEVRPEVTDEQLEHFCKEASRVTLSQVVEEVTVDERLSSKNEENGFSRDKLYTVNLSFYPRAEYEEEFRTDLEQILRSFSNSFIPIFDKEISKALKTANKGAKLSDVGKAQKGGSKDGKSVTETGDDLANGDGQGAVEDEIALPSTAEVDDIDGDADDARRAKQSQQVSSYDDDSDGEDEDDDTLGVPKDDAALEAAFADSDSEKGDKENEDEDSDVGSEDIDVKSEKLMKRQAKKEKKKREDRLAEVEDGAAKRSKFVEKMEFDKEEGAWAKLHLKFPASQPKLLLVGIVEACCRVAVVHQAPGITRCLVAAPEAGAKTEARYCVTEGVNLMGAWSFAHRMINMNSIYSNDVAAILRTYGVEAAKTVLIGEIQGVFGTYGIAVDRRHLTLIADYMTSEGGYKPFNRMGLANSPSPFLKASFETTASFVSDAALYGDFEDLTSPSASIVLGKPALSGTGVFAVAMPMNKLPEQIAA